MHSFKLKETLIQLLDENDRIVVRKAVLVEGDGLCAIYDEEEEHFKFTCTTRFKLNTILTTQNLHLHEVEEDERLCSECGKEIQEGFYFESDGTQYCSEDCLTKVLSWEEYLKIHDNGNGDAYWTDWYDC